MIATVIGVIVLLALVLIITRVHEPETTLRDTIASDARRSLLDPTRLLR